MNKKRMMIAAAALLLGMLTACGTEIESSSAGSTGSAETSSAAADTGSAGDSTESSADAEPSAAEGVSFVYNASGTEIAINSESDPIVEALGAPSETFEAPSCAFDGTSYTYTYAGFTLETYPDPDSGKNKVYAVTLTDGSVQTAEGVKVGDSTEAVTAACGEPDNETAAYMMYKGDGVALQFFLEGDAVTSIVYTYM